MPLLIGALVMISVSRGFAIGLLFVAMAAVGPMGVPITRYEAAREHRSRVRRHRPQGTAALVPLILAPLGPIVDRTVNVARSEDRSFKTCAKVGVAGSNPVVRSRRSSSSCRLSFRRCPDTLSDRH
jgi:hypothetical protein